MKLIDSSIIEQSQWIPVYKKLPEQHQSFFACYKNTNQWTDSMFEKRSDKVLVTVKYNNGKIGIEIARLVDNIWRHKIPAIEFEVLAWMPLPELYRENIKSYEHID